MEQEATGTKSHITIRDLTMAYGSFVVMRDLNFTINRGDVFIIMGGSGCGKSTLMRHMVGLKEPARGQILYGGVSFWELVVRSLRRHWKSHLWVLFGPAIGTAVLSGALLARDAVGDSLHKLVLQRLGRTEFVLDTGTRLITSTPADGLAIP